MRLFTALDLSPEVMRNLEDLLGRLRPTLRAVWSPPSNLHITTKFIGSWPEDRLGELKTALWSLAGRPAISVHVHRLAFFPNPHSPRVLTCAVEARGLEALAKDTDAATAALGVQAEDRPYKPHLTLARVKASGRLQPLREAIASLPSLDFGRFEAASFFLYESKLRPTGSVYTKLAEFPLTK
jgi:RNA 2',3'-cyclic 3'-phosphodiesterase